MQNAPALNSIYTMSSLDIALITGKEHKNVLADIRNMLLELYPNNTGAAEFSAVYKDQQDIDRPCFHLPKREALILTSGYSLKQKRRCDVIQSSPNAQRHETIKGR